MKASGGILPARGWGRLLLGLVLVAPLPARAHSPVQGLGDFVNGLLHPLTTPSHLLVLVALGLMAGREGRSQLKWPLISFAVLSAVALLVTTTGAIASVPPWVLIVIALLAGAFLALEKPPPRLMVSGFFGAGAVVLGLDSAVEDASRAGAARTLLGNWLSLSVLVADVALYVTMGREAKWLRVALRVLGAWIVAIGVLMLAFALRG